MVARSTAPTPPSASLSVDHVLSPDVVFLPVADGSARLLDLDGQFYALSAVGAEMLRGLLEQGAAATAIRVAAQYGESAQRVQADLDCLLHDLRRRGLIGNRTGQARRPVHSRWAPLVLTPALRLIGRSAHRCQFRAAVLLTLARLCFSVMGWARTVAAWNRALRQVEIGLSEEQKRQTINTIDQAVRRMATGHVLKMACKERALCCWFMLRARGIPAALVVGVHLFPLAGHCWCEVGSRVLSDYPDRCETYSPVVRYE